MKRLEFTIPHSLNVLHDELIAAFPGLGPMAEGGELVQVIRVESSGAVVSITVPEDADTDAITDLVMAHVPQPSPQGAKAELLGRIRGIKDTAHTEADFQELVRIVAEYLLV